ncbi:MAG TPA: hypothetical protein VL598_14780 [Trinickia sp.]|uniref:hypothetical protein n=1 Tax=Trinickia sp. TaxID=2571163 RepID=UPI002BD86C87|nr:hypothetical protein [Trinickia sp.]HTI18923.1 hypothetical protein [Trinickia sp.]
MQALEMALTADEANLVITALAERPFKLVYELIGKLNRQANVAAQTQADGSAYVSLLHASEWMLILDALGYLPYRQVSALVETLRLQMQAGFDDAGRAPKEARAAVKRGASKGNR